MIKAVDVVPKSIKVRPKTQLELIEDDIREAITNDIKVFEFIDERYNYANLANYARGPIHKLTEQAIQARFDEYIKDKPVRIEFKDVRYKIALRRDYNAYIYVHRVTDEEGKAHVYGHILPEGLDLIWEQYYLPVIKELVNAKLYWLKVYGKEVETAC